MNLDLRPVRRRRPVLNVTSLIDVLFLLLIFLMVSSTFVESPALELDLPAASSAESTRLDALKITIDRQGALFIGQEKSTLEALEARLEAAVEENPDVVVLLEADREVGYGVVIATVDTLRKVGVRRLTALTETASDG